MPEYKQLRGYKQIELDSGGKLQFFLDKHSTKEGTWAKLCLKDGAIDFVFLNGQGQELSRSRIDQENPELLIPPAAWHKIIPLSETFKASLEFYCMPQRYFNKKYGLAAVHHDLVYAYQTYLSHLHQASILDVGCGSGRNLLYLASLGHIVRGIDHNQAGLDKIQELAQKEQLAGVNTQFVDLNQPVQLEPECYDLVLSTVSLQFLNPQRIPDLLVELQKATSKKGYHFLVFPVHSEAYSLPAFFSYLPQKEELYHFYQDSGWSILEYKESLGHLHKLDEQGRQIPGLFALLVAQKTGSALNG